MSDDKNKNEEIDIQDVPQEAIEELSDNEGGEVGVG